jgi:hypothetical protein
VKEDEMGTAHSTNGEEEARVQVVGGKTRGKEQYTHNIRMDLGEVGWCGVDWIGIVNAALNLRVPQNAGKLSSGAQLQRVH